MKEEKTDRDLTRLAFISRVNMVIILTLAPILVVLQLVNNNSAGNASDAATSASQSSAAAKLSNDLAGCRAKFNIPLQDANGAIAEANEAKARIQDQLLLLVTRAFRANLEGDTAQFQALLEESKGIELQLAHIGQERTKAESARSEALKAYDAAIADSVDNPVALLRRCQATVATPPTASTTTTGG